MAASINFFGKPYSARIHYSQAHNADVDGMQEYGYASMPPNEETLVSYLSVGEASTLKTLSLPIKSLCVTLELNGRAYAAVGQAGGGALHMMAVLQAYQTDLLKNLDQG